MATIFDSDFNFAFLRDLYASNINVGKLFLQSQKKKKKKKTDPGNFEKNFLKNILKFSQKCSIFTSFK